MTQNVAMACPTCRISLVMSDRQGIEIDYCPQCRGVWLDRGELDKIIERSLPAAPAAAPPSAPQQHIPAQHIPSQHMAPPPQYGHSPQYYPKRRKSFLEELFD